MDHITTQTTTDAKSIFFDPQHPDRIITYHVVEGKGSLRERACYASAIPIEMSNIRHKLQCDIKGDLGAYAFLDMRKEAWLVLFNVTTLQKDMEIRLQNMASNGRKTKLGYVHISPLHDLVAIVLRGQKHFFLRVYNVSSGRLEFQSEEFEQMLVGTLHWSAGRTLQWLVGGNELQLWTATIQQAHTTAELLHSIVLGTDEIALFGWFGNISNWGNQENIGGIGKIYDTVYADVHFYIPRPPSEASEDAPPEAGEVEDVDIVWKRVKINHQSIQICEEDVGIMHEKDLWGLQWDGEYRIMGQYALCGPTNGNYSIKRLGEKERERTLAVHMATHRRLGQNSPILNFPNDLIRRISLFDL